MAVIQASSVCSLDNADTQQVDVCRLKLFLCGEGFSCTHLNSDLGVKRGMSPLP